MCFNDPEHHISLDVKFVAAAQTHNLKRVQLVMRSLQLQLGKLCEGSTFVCVHVGTLKGSYHFISSPLIILWREKRGGKDILHDFFFFDPLSEIYKSSKREIFANYF